MHVILTTYVVLFQNCSCGLNYGRKRLNIWKKESRKEMHTAMLFIFAVIGDARGMNLYLFVIEGHNTQPFLQYEKYHIISLFEVTVFCYSTHVFGEKYCGLKVLAYIISPSLHSICVYLRGCENISSGLCPTMQFICAWEKGMLLR